MTSHRTRSRHSGPPAKMSNARFYSILVACLIGFVCLMAVIDGIVNGG